MPEDPFPTFGQLVAFHFQGNSAYACEPFVTTSDGGGFVRNGQIKNIFALNSRKKTKNDEADRLLDFIWNNFNMLPFALRWIVNDWEEKQAKDLLNILIKKKAVQAYPVLIEINEKRVAQAEHTFIPNEEGATVTTRIQ